MSTVNIDDLQYVPSDQTVQVPPSNNDTVIYQLPFNSAQINTQVMQNLSPYPPMISSYNENSEIMAAAVVYDPRYSHQSFSGNILDIWEYKKWSIFNMIFCCAIVGGCALHMSCMIKKKKRHGDLLRAQSYSRLAALLNVVATFSGIFAFTIATLRFFSYI